VINLANKRWDRPYTNADLELHTYPQATGFTTFDHYSRWWREYRARFGVEFALDLGDEFYRDQDIPPEEPPIEGGEGELTEFELSSEYDSSSEDDFLLEEDFRQKKIRLLRNRF
jgi:hypothetical protein